MTQFESGIKQIPYSQEKVYNKLSDLNNLETIKDKIPTDQIQNLTFDSDTLSFSISPVGQLSLQIVEREPHKCIKFSTTNSPIPFDLWIQVLPMSENEAKMKLTIRAELNVFIKSMVSKPLQNGIEKLADTLAAIPY